MSDNEVDVDRILAAIASADTNISSRGRTAPRFVVLGNTRWNRMNNIDRTMFFKDRVIFISTYHAKRDSQTILDFDSAYIRSFGSLPTLFSYRGYDAAVIFCPGDVQRHRVRHGRPELRAPSDLLSLRTGRGAPQPRQPQLDESQLQQRLHDNRRIARLWHL